jgi:hypothetical protein
MKAIGYVHRHRGNDMNRMDRDVIITQALSTLRIKELPNKDPSYEGRPIKGDELIEYV